MVTTHWIPLDKVTVVVSVIGVVVLGQASIVNVLSSLDGPKVLHLSDDGLTPHR